MAELEGAAELGRRLTELARLYQREGEAAVAVGYTANYALFVHEAVGMVLKGLSRDPRVRRIEQGGDPAKARPRPRKKEPRGRYWDPQGRGQAKFLETPLRTERDVLARIVIQALARGQPLSVALFLAGLRLQRESQRLVPVDTGNLKASAFTRLEAGGGGSAAGEAGVQAATAGGE
jgi:hypothetical protein